MSGDQSSFQARVAAWTLDCFGREIAFDRTERGDRVLEETLELLQSGGYDPARVAAMRDYVFGRAAGEPDQELGGVMVTLAAYAAAFGLDLQGAGETELARILTKTEAIRAKQATKPTGAALTARAAAGALRTVGLIGGLSWESSAEYYRLLNQGVRDRLGPTASAPCLMWSFNFAEIEALQHAGDWAALTARMVEAAQRLEAAGAETLLICSNTMHQMADEVQAATRARLLHIADPTADAIRAAGLTRVGLLGTAFTMEQDFYRGRLAARGLEVITPGPEDRALVHRVIYEELVAGQVLEASRDAYRAVIARLVAAGAQAVILGCTEIMLLVRPEDSAVPLFDTTALHAEAGVAAVLGG